MKMKLIWQSKKKKTRLNMSQFSMCLWSNKIQITKLFYNEFLKKKSMRNMTVHPLESMKELRDCGLPIGHDLTHSWSYVNCGRRSYNISQWTRMFPGQVNATTFTFSPEEQDSWKPENCVSATFFQTSIYWSLTRRALQSWRTNRERHRLVFRRSDKSPKIKQTKRGDLSGLSGGLQT